MAQTIASTHADFARRTIQWARIRDALEGQDEIKQNGETYLKKPDGMSLTAYDAYKERAQYYPVVERTLRGMSGMVFRHPVKADLPAKLEPLREACTTDGHSLEVFAEQVVNEVLSIGRYGILVDYPSENTTANSTPYLATYTAENITDWKVQFVDGLRTLTRVVLKDDYDGDDDTDGTAEMRLELTLNVDGNYEVKKWVAASATKAAKDGDTAQFVLTDTKVPTVNGKPLKKIPFVFINPYDLRPEVEKPPMLDLVDVNIGHYRNSADYEHALFLTAQPTPWVAGNLTKDSTPTSIGSGAFWILPEGATCGMLEFSGPGIEAQERAMAAKEDRMASLGARMIHEGKNRNEAADTAKMRGKGEMSLLTNVVNMAEAGIERALRIAAEWTTGRPDDVEVKLNRDWVETKMDPQTLTAMVKAWQSGAMSHMTLYENLQSGEIAPVDRTYEEEKDLIEEEGGDLGMGLMQDMVVQATQPPVKPGDKAPPKKKAPDDGGAEEAGGTDDADR